MSIRRAAKTTSQRIEARVEVHKPNCMSYNVRTVGFRSVLNVLEFRASECRGKKIFLTHSSGLPLIHATL